MRIVEHNTSNMLLYCCYCCLTSMYVISVAVSRSQASHKVRDVSFTVHTKSTMNANLTSSQNLDHIKSFLYLYHNMNTFWYNIAGNIAIIYNYLLVDELYFWGSISNNIYNSISMLWDIKNKTISDLRTIVSKLFDTVITYQKRKKVTFKSLHMGMLLRNINLSPAKKRFTII